MIVVWVQDESVVMKRVEMNANRVTCPHCGEAQIESQHQEGSVAECPRCAKEFPVSKQLPVATISVSNEQEVIKVRCQICAKKFGIKPKMSGRSLACPHCKNRQKFILSSEKIFSTEDAESPSLNAQEAQVLEANANENRATVIQGPQPTGGGTSEISDRARQLLPPRYMVDEAAEQIALQESVKALSQATPSSSGLASNNGIGINTEITRIHREGSESVSVRSLSRDQKDRRKSIRVAVIYVVSVIILITLCILLVQTVGSVD